jgi:hypothetical protein
VNPEDDTDPNGRLTRGNAVLDNPQPPTAMVTPAGHHGWPSSALDENSDTPEAK